MDPKTHSLLSLPFFPCWRPLKSSTKLALNPFLLFFLAFIIFLSSPMALSSINIFRKQVTLLPIPFLALHPCPVVEQVLATAPPPPPYLRSAMATATPAATTTIPLPDYQVSGAAAAHQRGSVGPFVGVLAAVLMLTALSCFFGRVCAAHAQGPDEWYDCTRLAGRRRCWWWPAPRRPVRPAEEEAKPPPAMPLPEP